jgi:glycerol-3-phosphate dehydrogenase
MLRNAPHLVRNLSFIIPAYDWWNGPFYTVGLKVYDMMAGKMGFGASFHLSREETMEALPNVEHRGLKGGIIYHDGQFDDARMLISLARTCAHYRGRLANYVKVTGIVKEKGLIKGVEASDQETGEEFQVKARVVINATGVFADDLLAMDAPGERRMIRPSQGVHLVLGQEFLSGQHAIMVPHTSDGRVMFAVPWYDRVVLGTTDTLISQASLEPRPLEEEIDFILRTAGKYLIKKPGREDVLSAFAGLRPLAAPEAEGKPTREISRHHKVIVSVSGLITILGGKWTTYRKMGEDAVNYAVMVGNLPEVQCTTRDIKIHGFTIDRLDRSDPLSVYGSEYQKLKGTGPKGEDRFSGKSLRIYRSQVKWAVQYEMARTLEDVLARRTRALFLDAGESMELAPEVARVLAGELGRGREWIEMQIKQYTELAGNYLVGPHATN